VFWHQGGLHVHPESKREGQLLGELLNGLKVGKPPELDGPTTSGQSLGGQDLQDCLAGDHQILPSSNVLESHNKQTVVAINKVR
jgi:hypothetical protein